MTVNGLFYKIHIGSYYLVISLLVLFILIFSLDYTLLKVSLSILMLIEDF